MASKLGIKTVFCQHEAKRTTGTADGSNHCSGTLQNQSRVSIYNLAKGALLRQWRHGVKRVKWRCHSKQQEGV